MDGVGIGDLGIIFSPRYGVRTRTDRDGEVGGVPLRSTIGGVLRGILHSGIQVFKGQKVADVDPRGDPSLCFTISDKANAVAGGVLEAAFRESAARPLVTME